MKIGFIVNEVQTQLPEYTTPHLMMAAANLGHEVWCMGAGDLGYGPDENTYAHARMAPTRQHRATRVFLDELRGEQNAVQRIRLEDLDVLMLRHDPGEDMATRPWARLAAINFGRLTVRHGVLVLNDPNGLMQAVNKMYLEYFPEEVRPRSLISRNRDVLRTFVKEQGGYAVFKPLFGSSGRNVFLITPDEPNINQIIETVCGVGYVLAQEYLPGAVQGDTRLFLMNGEPWCVDGKYAALHRKRKSGDNDIRSNMSRGAIAVKANVTKHMLRLAELVRPKLIEDGMFLVGLDIVDDKLMEINVFSPAGLTSASSLEEVNFHQELIHAVERKVEYVRAHGTPFDNAHIATLSLP